MERCLNKYYTSVHTLILYNWILFLKNGEVKYLLKDESKTSLFNFLGIKIFGVKKAGHLAYERLQNDMIDTCGVSKEYLNIQQSEIRIAKMYYKMLSSGDKSMQLLITVEEIELEKIKEASKANKNDSILHSLNRIESLQNGCRYNPKEITFYEFTELAKLVSKKQA